MKKPIFHTSHLQIVYLIIIIILFSLIIYTPTLIRGPVHLTNKLILEEDTIEGILVGILFIISVLILNLYKNEVNKHKELIDVIKVDKRKVEERLHVSDQYIGKVNVQLREIESIYNSIDNYPKSKKELKKTLSYYGERILGIVKSNWVLIRIINCSTQRTISEHYEALQNTLPVYPHVSNKMILENKQPELHTSVVYNPANLDILVFCILPVEKISQEERIFIQAIIDELTKLFVVINSVYYKNSNRNIEGNKPDN